MSKILLIDIETAPHLAYVWGAWKQNVGSNQWKSRGYIMSFAAKWLGDSEIMYMENRTDDDKAIVTTIYSLLDMADIVIAHNGKKFDLPEILTRGIVHGLKPPSNYFIVDTCESARKHFRFTNNSLAVLADYLKVSKKGNHAKFPGFELWVQCLKQNDEAWREMQDYNIQDVQVLEEIYLKLRPYITNHPNVAVPGEELSCPKCGSHRVQRRGYYRSRAGLYYQRYQCMDCGGWFRSSVGTKDKPKTLSRNTT